MHHAVAVDFGASSGRYAHGWLEDGQIDFKVIRQTAHAATEKNGTLFWDLHFLLSLVREAAEYAATEIGESTLGIDAWGVDHGFIGHDGQLISEPVCYRDRSHQLAFDRLAPQRSELYALTGCQHLPLNTICQLMARDQQDPLLKARVREWMVLPDLFAYLLTGERNADITQASTTQLLGLDGQWSAEACKIAGWPVPEIAPSLPGRLGRHINSLVQLAHVGSHDTASAVAGFGELADDQIFVNVGTWSLMGCVIDAPIATPEAEKLNLTNERTIDGRVRLLKNVAGFYVINRIHEELGVQASVPEWLGAKESVDESVDLTDERLFNPDSMLDTCAALSGRTPKTEAEWAGLALASLANTLAQVPSELSAATGRTFTSLRVGGGGSQSASFCQALADASGLLVIAGPSESTVLGNLAVQFLAQGAIANLRDAQKIIARSISVNHYTPLR